MCQLRADEGADETRCVLIVEDEPSVADALRVILEDEGFSVTVAANGRDGITEARRARFGVTVTDLRLPDMDGFEVLAALSESGLGGAVILITSHVTPEIFARARDLGAVAVIAKPFLPADILQLIAAALGSPRACEPQTDEGTGERGSGPL